MQFVGLIIPLGWLLHTHGASPEANWIGMLWSFNLSFLLWQYLLGFRINNQASAEPAPAWHAVTMVPLLFVFSAVESYAALLGVLRFVGLLHGQKVSEVIHKPR